MRLIPLYLLFLALLAITFAWWGLETKLGQQSFDEMDGLYPFFTGIGGLVLMALSLLLLILQRRK
ncbi:MAG: hypothetical protein ABJO86_12740 [Lentilitoribacter sp.]